MQRRNKIFLGLGVPLALALLAVMFLPWQHWFASELREQLAQRGLSELRFEVGGAGLGTVTFNDIGYGNPSPFNMAWLTAGYDATELARGRVREIRTGPFIYRRGGIMLGFAGAEMKQVPHDDAMHGTWAIRDIATGGLPVLLPVLQGQGTLKLDDGLFLEGTLQSADASHKAVFDMVLPEGEEGEAAVRIKSLTLPWNGGTLRLRPVTYPLTGTGPVTLTLELSRVSLQHLMQLAVGESAQASGRISGQVPVTVARDGSFTLGKGNLQTDDNGVISLPAAAIPGDHPKVEVVREILKNFHYTDFSLTLRSDEPDKLSMLLSLKGNNPEVYNGRSVNLNVNLTGDLLNLLEQGMVTMTDPRQLLKQDSHETD